SFIASRETTMLGQAEKWKIEQTILPFVFSAEKLKWRPLYISYNIYDYSRGLLTALVGAGLSTPAFDLYERVLNPSRQVTSSGSAQSPLAGIPNEWMPWVVVVAVSLIIARMVIEKTNAEKRVILARSCQKEARKFHDQLQNALQAPDVESKIEGIGNKTTEALTRYRDEDVWPWREWAPRIN